MPGTCPRPRPVPQMTSSEGNRALIHAVVLAQSLVTISNVFLRMTRTVV